MSTSAAQATNIASFLHRLPIHSVPGTTPLLYNLMKVFQVSPGDRKAELGLRPQSLLNTQHSIYLVMLLLYCYLQSCALKLEVLLLQ